MIRDFKDQDIEAVMTLWFQTNISAHPFVEYDYWEKSFDDVKNNIMLATLYVYEENSMIRGFIGLSKTYVAGIFVADKYQSKGIGKKLLDHAKKNHNQLSLTVFMKNKKAVDFYLREDFTILCEQTDKHTKEIEFCMSWKRKL